MSLVGMAVELRDGSLRFDPGGQVPTEIHGYKRDAADPYRLNLVAMPSECPNRDSRVCSNGNRREWCKKKALPVNPGACSRCQGLL